MMHITDYIKQQQKSFEAAPFNPLDSLVLSSLSYLNLEHAYTTAVRDEPKVLLGDVVKHSDTKQLTKGFWIETSSRTPAFFEGLCASKRYKGTRVGFYTNEVSKAQAKQFSAVTLVLPHGVMYISYRGTDLSYTGWKEDFDLAYKAVVPSQVSAEEYVTQVSKELSNTMILGGHSKGGNLAEYAALVVQEDIYKRIVRVFNHDGPSFLEEPSKRFETPEYNNKLHKTVPAASPIGMILEQRSNYHVVKSDGILVLQHEPFSWIVDGDDFVYKKEADKENTLFCLAFNRMIRESTIEDKEKLVKILFELLHSTKTETWADFGQNIIKHSQKLLEESEKLDNTSKGLLEQFEQQFMEALKEEFFKL